MPNRDIAPQYAALAVPYRGRQLCACSPAGATGRKSHGMPLVDRGNASGIASTSGLQAGEIIVIPLSRGGA